MVRVRLSRSGFASFERSPVRVNPTVTSISPYRVAGAVHRVAKFVPGALCLAQAVSAQRLLAKFGFHSTMRVGVKSDESDVLKAHAWLIHEDRVILGGTTPELEDYTIMTDTKSATAG